MWRGFLVLLKKDFKLMLSGRFSCLRLAPSFYIRVTLILSI